MKVTYTTKQTFDIPDDEAYLLGLIIESRGTISAIKHIRKKYNLGLRESKNIVDHGFANQVAIFRAENKRQNRLEQAYNSMQRINNLHIGLKTCSDMDDFTEVMDQIDNCIKLHNEFEIK